LGVCLAPADVAPADVAPADVAPADVAPADVARFADDRRGARYRTSVIVAFDPGRNVGVAYVGEDGALRRRAIVTLEAVDRLDVPDDAVVLVGNGTGSAALRARLAARGLDVRTVAEEGTSLEARELFYREHPAKGWSRLLPVGMRSPPVAIDDYAAYAIALRWLASRA
jgi:hypothetical protein